MGLEMITARAALPVTVAEAKRHIGIESSDWDDLIEEFIDAATDQVEAFIGRAVMAQTWKLWLDGFSDAIELPRGPVTSVSAITYYDADSVVHTADPSIYVVDLVSDPQWVVLSDDQSWPETMSGVNAVAIEFVTGFAEAPADMKMAIRSTVAAWYANRADMSLPDAAKAALRRYRRMVI